MGIEKKAERYSNFVKKEEGNSCNFYTIKIEDKGKEKTWNVIENVTKGTWTCTCLFFTLKGTECSHILGCKKFNEKHGI